MLCCILSCFFFFAGGVSAGMALSQGKVARTFAQLSGKRAFDSRFYIIVVTRAGLFMIILV